MKTCLQITYASGEIKLEPLGHGGALPANLGQWLDDPAADTVEILRVSDSEWACRTTPNTREPKPIAERVECESVSERDLWLREQDRAFAWLGEPGRPTPSEHADACVLAARAVARERAEIAVAPLDPVPGIDTFTVQIKPTASEPLLVFTWTGSCFPFGKREVSTVLRFSTLFAARATQEVGYRRQRAQGSDRLPAARQHVDIAPLRSCDHCRASGSPAEPEQEMTMTTTPETVTLKSRRTPRPGGPQIFTFSTPTGEIERSLSPKRSDAGGRLAFCFYKGTVWECGRVVADTPRNAEYLRAHEQQAGRVVVFVDATRPPEPGCFEPDLEPPPVAQPRIVQVHVFEDELADLAAAADHLDVQARKKENTLGKLVQHLPVDAFLVYSDLRRARRREEPESEILARLEALPDSQRRGVNRAFRLLADADRFTALSGRLSVVRKRFEAEFSMAARPVPTLPALTEEQREAGRAAIAELIQEKLGTEVDQ